MVVWIFVLAEVMFFLVMRKNLCYNKTNVCVGVSMYLELEINDTKSSMFLKLLDIYKMDNIVSTYRVLPDSTDESDFMADMTMLKETWNDAQKGLGKHTGKYVELEDK